MDTESRDGVWCVAVDGGVCGWIGSIDLVGGKGEGNVCMCVCVCVSTCMNRPPHLLLLVLLQPAVRLGLAVERRDERLVLAGGLRVAVLGNLRRPIE